MEFEGFKTLALLDTGSPVTIVSLEFAVKALVKKRPEGQQVEEWKKEVRARLESPMVKLLNYGGGELNIVGQMKAHLSRGKHALEGVVQIQKGAPVELLVGTDTQPQLGFLFLDTSLGDTPTDLFNGKKWDLSESQTVSTPPVEAPRAVSPRFPVVNLINATRLPARHSKFVRARLDNPKEKSFTLFEPAKEALKEVGLLMEEGVAQPDASGFLTLIVQNHSFSPVCLKKGQILGQLQPATQLATTPEEAVENQVKSIGPQRPIEPTLLESENQFLAIPPELETNLQELSETESAQLRILLAEYSDLFAQFDSDLGSTEVVTHSINTGDHPPI